MIETTNCEKATPFDRLILALVGQEKGGKSRTAATGRKPVLFFDYDRRKESVAGIPGVFAITISDPAEPFKIPTAYNEGLDILPKLEKPDGKLSDIDPKWPPMRPKTVVLDSAQTFGKAAMRYVLYTTPELRRQVSIGGKAVVNMPKSWDGWNAETALVEQFVFRLFAIPDMDVIVIFHEVSERAPDSSDEEVKLTGKIAVYPVRYKVLLKNFNELWRVTRTGQVPTIQLVPDFQFTAATNLGLLTADKPDIAHLIQISQNGGKPQAPPYINPNIPTTQTQTKTA